MNTETVGTESGNFNVNVNNENDVFRNPANTGTENRESEAAASRNPGIVNTGTSINPHISQGISRPRHSTTAPNGSEIRIRNSEFTGNVFRTPEDILENQNEVI